MTGRTIVITGASDGIGAAAARRLHRTGETVVIVGRSADKTRSLAEELGTDYFVADFADLSAVVALADGLRSRYPRIDVLANNAGGMAPKGLLTVDNFEWTYQVNYLAPFLLTTRLLDVLVDSRSAVVSTSSSAQRCLVGVGVEDLLHTRRPGPGTAYALTKLAGILFTKELHRRYHDCGLSSVAFHPGYLDTNLGPASGWRSMALLQLSPTMRWAPKADRGARHLVRFASGVPGRDWKSGEYYSLHRIARTNRAGRDLPLMRTFWDRTAEQVDSWSAEGPATARVKG
jgi:NAD(P)-dependent dehydrogenase (short-subunit alcohol dehydrogenase family)